MTERTRHLTSEDGDALFPNYFGNDLFISVATPCSYTYAYL